MTCDVVVLLKNFQWWLVVLGVGHVGVVLGWLLMTVRVIGWVQ